MSAWMAKGMNDMTRKEALERQAAEARIEIMTIEMPRGVRAAYARGGGASVIGLSADLDEPEACCACAEALGHHFAGGGNALAGGSAAAGHSRRRASAWAFEALLPLEEIAAAYAAQNANARAMAQALEVTVDFLDRAMRHYARLGGWAMAMCSDVLVEVGEG